MYFRVFLIVEAFCHLDRPENIYLERDRIPNSMLISEAVKAMKAVKTEKYI